jgi:hypothetical protein
MEFRPDADILFYGQLLGGVIFLSKLLRGVKEVLYLLAGVIKYLVIGGRRYSHTDRYFVISSSFN